MLTSRFSGDKKRKTKRHFSIYRKLFNFSEEDLSFDCFLKSYFEKETLDLNINKYLYQILSSSEFDSIEFTKENIQRNIQNKINEICANEEEKPVMQY